jgi:cytochrome c553
MTLGLLVTLQSAASRAGEYGYCLVCHGSDAAGNAAIEAPNLTILPPWYLRSQLHAFKARERGWDATDLAGQSIASAARRLADEDAIDGAIGFIGAYPVQTAAATLEGDARRGAGLYTGCAACHGDEALGQEAIGAPPLAGQSDWYLAKALMDYRSGRRGAVSTTTGGAAMAVAAQQLPDEQAVYDVVAYLQDLATGAVVASTSAASAGASSGPTDNEESTTMTRYGTKGGLGRALPALALAAATSSVLAQDVTRHPLPGGSTFPIAQAVTVPAGTELLFHSGLLPAPADPDAERGSRAYYGDTYTQTMSVLQRFEASLKEKGMGLGNIIKMNVFMVGDPELDGQMDFGGFMKAYSQFFGTEEQPNLPARAAVQVAGLANGALIEIEVIAAR